MNKGNNINELSIDKTELQLYESINSETSN